MNSLVRRLLSGASLATLQLCAASVARASAPIAVTAAQTTGPITVAAGQHPDLIAISGTVTGDVTNDGTVGIAGISNIGVIVTGTIDGTLRNAKGGIIYATASGIDVGPTANIAGGIDNEGKILVTRTSDPNTPMYGINDANAGTLTNSGTIALTAGISARSSQANTAGVDLTVVRQHVSQNFASAPVSASISNSGTIAVQADVGISGASAGRESGILTIFSQGMNLNNIASGVATLSESNSGKIAATLAAFGVSEASAGVVAFYQTAGHAESAKETVDNTGSMTLNVKLDAQNDLSGLLFGTLVDADALLIRQSVQTVDNAELTVNNAGKMAAHVTAAATALSRLDTLADVTGIRQSEPHRFTSSSEPFSASMRMTNSGTIALSAKVVADVTGVPADAYASGEAEVFAVEQAVSGGVTLTESFSNSGRIDVLASASQTLKTPPVDTSEVNVAAAATGLIVSAGGSSGVFHLGNTTHTVSMPSPLSAKISNSGTIDIAAVATGLSANATANGIIVARASTTAITNVRVTTTNMRSEDDARHSRAEPLSGSIDNSGNLIVGATAIGGNATAEAVLVRSSDPDISITNSGLIAASADGATAIAQGLKLASHSNLQRVKFLHGSSILTSENQIYTNVFVPADVISRTVSNSGDLVVNAIGSVNANAEGISLNTLNMAAEIVNSGDISVAATGPIASAVGLKIHAMRSGTSRSFPEQRTTGGGFTEVIRRSVLATAIAGGKFTGTVDNSGTIAVSATGSGATKATAVEVDEDSVTGKILNEGEIAASASGTGAIATGLAVNAASFNGSLINKGTISASATGSDASAKAVVFATTRTGSAALFENDGGTISAFVNGVWGTAIDASAASTLAITLNGGSIVGNIVENPSGNAIAINSRNLLLDGFINPSKAKLGSLTVGANGTLTLATDVQGDATAYVASYVQKGTLVIPGTLDGSSGSIHAAAATLSGQAVVDLQLSGAPYALSTTYKVVFSDAALSGTWSSVVPDMATTFFSGSGVYSANEADITLTRAAFDGVQGLTANEQAVGHVIETLYDGGSSGVMSKLIGALFNLTPTQYADALQALSGVPAGELSAANQSVAQSFLDQINSHMGDPATGGDTVSSLLSGGTQLAAAPTDVTPAQASSFSGTKVWGGGFQSGNSVDRTAAGPAYTSHQSGLLTGVDVPVSNNVLLGMVGSYNTGDIKTEKSLGFGTFNGAQIAGYGRFVADNGLYALADVSYGSFTNKLNRYVSIPGFGAGNLRGTFDSTAWGLYGEAGWRFTPAPWSVTPYAAISYLDADSDGYKEAGTFLLPLTVAGSSSKATSSYLGVKLSTDWQLGTAMLTPRLTAAWQHDYTKNAWEMGAAFTAVPTLGFGLTGAGLSRDTAFVDGGVTLHAADQVDVLLDYQGRFNADRTDNAFLARANIRF